VDWLNSIVQGVLLGGLYALFATGLALLFGVMRLVNIAHGDLIVLAAFVALVCTQATGLPPLLALPVVVPLMAALGYGLQRGLLNRTLLDRTSGGSILPPLLVTFGLSIILQNLLLEIFTADSRRLQAGALETMSLELAPGLAVGIMPLMVFVAALIVIGGLQFVLFRTALGRALRATSDDPETAGLMAIDQRHMFALAMAIAMAVVAIAGVFLAIRTNFDPSSGPSRLLFAFEAVIIGGLGSLWGTLAGGVILGVAQAIGARIDPGWQLLAGHVAFLLILVVRPSGLFPRMR
jgi:branched-chain amino acid transport system permease protein